jgi:hypothetical protein
MREDLDRQEGLVRVPHGNGSGDAGENFQVALAAGVSSAATALPTSPVSGQYVTFVCDAAWTIRGGAAGITAAVATDFPIAAGVERHFWFSKDETHFRAFSTAGGTLNYYVSGTP